MRAVESSCDHQKRAALRLSPPAPPEQDGHHDVATRAQGRLTHVCLPLATGTVSEPRRLRPFSSACSNLYSGQQLCLTTARLLPPLPSHCRLLRLTAPSHSLIPYICYPAAFVATILFTQQTSTPFSLVAVFASLTRSRPPLRDTIRPAKQPSRQTSTIYTKYLNRTSPLDSSAGS